MLGVDGNVLHPVLWLLLNALGIVARSKRRAVAGVGLDKDGFLVGGKSWRRLLLLVHFNSRAI